MNSAELKARALELHSKPLFALMHEAHTIHQKNFDPQDIQKCQLLSIKTGGCPEDCAYCPQSAHYKTNLKKEALLDLDFVKSKITEAKELGAERFCMGAAWREVRDGEEFDAVLQMVKLVKEQGMEACVTLGMLNVDQAKKLKDAGLDAYNHNLDTSPEFYSKIISTRTYQDRLDTIQNVRDAGITVCSGGIIGMGETIQDRCGLIAELASLDPQPESVPINLLMSVEGTPLANQESVPVEELLKIISIARIMIPKARVRLSAGRIYLNEEAHLLCYYAGANSIFIGEKLLTRPNSNLQQAPAWM